MVERVDANRMNPASFGPLRARKISRTARASNRAVVFIALGYRRAISSSLSALSKYSVTRALRRSRSTSTRNPFWLVFTPGNDTDNSSGNAGQSDQPVLTAVGVNGSLIGKTGLILSWSAVGSTSAVSPNASRFVCPHRC